MGIKTLHLFFLSETAISPNDVRNKHTHTHTHTGKASKWTESSTTWCLKPWNCVSQLKNIRTGKKQHLQGIGFLNQKKVRLARCWRKSWGKNSADLSWQWNHINSSSAILVNWWFGARWFGNLGVPKPSILPLVDQYSRTDLKEKPFPPNKIRNLVMMSSNLLHNSKLEWTYSKYYLDILHFQHKTCKPSKHCSKTTFEKQMQSNQNY